MTAPVLGDLVRITTNIATSHFGDIGQVVESADNAASVWVEFSTGHRQWFSPEELEIVAAAEDFVIFNKAHLPKVIRDGNSVETLPDDFGVSWSFGVDPQEAPDATDPLHILAVIDYFNRNNLPLHSGKAGG